MSNFDRMNELLQTREDRALKALARLDPADASDVGQIAITNAMLAQVAATKMVVTVLLAVDERLRRAALSGW